jgi:membrane fusion protein (multidrug efflux system)
MSRKWNARHRIKSSLVITVVIATLSYVGWEYFADKTINTNIAYIEGERHTLRSVVPAQITTILVKPGEPIQIGNPILLFDQRDWLKLYQDSEQERKIIKASLLHNAAQLALLDDITAAQKASGRILLNSIQTAQKMTSRQEKLGDYVIEREKEKATLAVLDRQMLYHEGQESLLSTLSQIETHKSNIDSLNIQLAQIENHQVLLTREQQNYTIITPYNGQVHDVHVSIGGTVNPGEPLVTITRNDDFWVTAYFKETELNRLQRGTKVHITLDAYPNHDFPGRVVALSRLAGAALSPSTPNYSAGNFTRIVQRIPVHIRFDKAPNTHLAIGLSARVTVIK